MDRNEGEKMKKNAVKYGLISRDDMLDIKYLQKAETVAAFMLGRRLSRWIVLKITDDSAKVVDLCTRKIGGEVCALAKELENA
jgi:hypothetical protein